MSGSGSKIVKTTIRQVKPILSLDKAEARRRVLNLYRAWHRQLPYIILDYDVPKTLPQLQVKLREEFLKNKHVQDIRVVDMLCLKGQMELKEVAERWKQNCHIMTYFKETVEPKPQGFLSKFLTGQD